MKHIIAGTAGHIDHGKTALVRALTGIETDRLKEEKERGISIDLGFAHLDLATNLRLGFVDVPGHERFIKNMLAGASGIDLVLFVIAADESIKPQTREHFDICRLLAIPRGIVVLTKADLVDPEILELVRMEAEEFVRGSFLENAPVVAVSSTTGAGIETLRSEMARMAAEVHEKHASRYFRLPVDRAFSMRGFGAVVTGTLVAGSVATDQDVEVHPGGRRLRVRGLQVHGETVGRATAGQRTALNVAGVDAAELRRGLMLAEAGRFNATTVVDAAFELLASARALKHRAPVHFHAHTAEIEAEVRLFSGAATMKPGTRGFARFALREPAQLLPGDRFVVRMFSPVVTIGGGVVLDVAPPRRDTAQRLDTLERGAAAERVAQFVSEAKYGMSMPELVARTGLTEAEVVHAAEQPALIVLREPHFWALDRAWLNAKLDALQAALKTFHRQNPLAPGMAKEELRSRELTGAPAFLLDAILRHTRTIAVAGDVVHLTSHRVALKQDEQNATAAIERAFESAGLAVPGTHDVLAKSGVDAARARTLLQMLVREKRLVKVSEELVFHASAILQLRNLLAERKGKRFAVPEFKEWTGISRKYAIPLLEYLDRERLTRRDGDSRIVL